MAIATINPATGETLKTFTPLTDAEIETKLALAQSTFEQYRNTTFAQRSQWLIQAATILEQDKVKFAHIMTTEMGKTLKSAIAEVEKCAMVCRFYADKAPEFLADVSIPTDASHSYIAYQPLGTILAVMPWNFPFWQVFRFAAPALMAGNVGILKHASNVPQSALAALASTAGQQIKKVVLELGGSDPFIVLESADLEEAVATAVKARMLNNGQSCIAAKRFIVAESIAKEFQQQLFAQLSALTVGDPLETTTDIGPLATATILDELDQQVQAAVKQGATVLIGGKPLTDRPGNYYPPTILTNIPVDSTTAQEEFFGPVALLFTVKNIDQAIALANNIPFGLGASAWTNNTDESNRLTREIESLNQDYFMFN